MLSRGLISLLLALFVCSSQAHIYLNSLVIDGSELPRGDCLRPQRAFEPENPLPNVYVADMTCGWLPEAANPANRRCPVEAGSTIGLQWYHNHPGSDDNIIDPTHKGPCIVYMAKSNDGAGPVWFKIFEQGLGSDGKWCTDVLIENRGLLEVTIPSDIVAGDYLLRGEITALHNGYAIDGAQLYVSCAELTISGSGNKNPSSAGVAFPGYYSDTDPGFLINLYGPPITQYTIPGPPIYKSGSAIVPPPSHSSSTSSSTTGTITNVNSGIVSTCGSLTLSQTFRSYWSDPDGTMHKTYDFHIINTGPAVSNVALSIIPNGANIEEVWNMRNTGGNNYVITEPVNYRPSVAYTGAGYISKYEATVSFICSTTDTVSSTTASSTVTTGSTSSTTSSTSTSTTSPVSQSVSTTGTHTNPSTSTTTGNHVSSTTTTGTNSKTCKAGISFAAGQSWTNGGIMSITISNTGSKPINSVKLHINGEISTWNLDSTSVANVFTLPSWATPIQAGSTFTNSGFTYSGKWSGFIVSVTC